MLNEIEILNKHKNLADRQRAAFNFQKNNLKDDEMIIVADWKQKVNFNSHLII